MTNGLTRVQVRVYCTAGFSFVKSIIVFSQPVLLRLIRSGSDEKFCFASEKLKGNSPLDSFSEMDHLITIIFTAKTDRSCLNLTRFNTCQSQRGNISNNCNFFIIYFYIQFLLRRETEGEGGKCCGPNNALFTENSRVWRPNLKRQQLFRCYHYQLGLGPFSPYFGGLERDRERAAIGDIWYKHWREEQILTE